jgi:hypothetical protein
VGLLRVGELFPRLDPADPGPRSGPGSLSRAELVARRLDGEITSAIGEAIAGNATEEEPPLVLLPPEGRLAYVVL